MVDITEQFDNLGLVNLSDFKKDLGEFLKILEMLRISQDLSENAASSQKTRLLTRFLVLQPFSSKKCMKNEKILEISDIF